MKALKKKANNYDLEGVKLVIKQGFNFVPSANGQNNIVPANDSSNNSKSF